MKPIWSALANFFGTVLLCVACGCSHVKPYQETDLSPAIVKVESVAKTLDGALRTKVVAKKDAAIVVAKQEVSSVKADLTTQQIKVSGLVKTNSDQVIKISKLEDRVSHLEHLLFLCSALLSILAMGIAWELLKAIPYGPWIVLAIGGVTFTSSWFGLGHLL